MALLDYRISSLPDTIRSRAPTRVPTLLLHKEALSIFGLEPSILASEDLAIQKKLEVLALIEKPGSVSAASLQSGVSRDTIHRHLRLVKKSGPGALKRQETPNLRQKNCVDKAIENAVVQFSIEHTHLGLQKVAIKLSEVLGVDISAGCVRSIWLRNNMNTTALRVEKSYALAESA